MPSPASRASMLRRHDLGGVAVGGGEVELGLAVERLLADLDGQAPICRRSAARETVDRLAQPLPRHHPVDEPERRAVAASISSPVSSISIAALRPTARVSATIGVEQKRPILTPGVANRASSAATARSQVATSWQPAAVATPCTSAMTGFGNRTICSISSLH